MTDRRRFLTLPLAAAIAGCAAPMTRVGGDVVIGDRIVVPADSAWNQLPGTAGRGATAVWTQEGLFIDLIQYYVGVKDGAELVPAANKEQRPIVFRASMQPHEVLGLFESLYTRDGSTFSLDRLEPATFLGQRGWQARYTVLRKVDDVRLSGLAWATVTDGQLHAMTFTAPAIGFYPRLAPKVEKLAAAARLR